MSFHRICILEQFSPMDHHYHHPFYYIDSSHNPIEYEFFSLIEMKVFEHTVWTLLKTRDFIDRYLSDQRYWTSTDTKLLITESSAVRLPILLANASKASSTSDLTERDFICDSRCCLSFPQSSVSSVQRFWSSKSRSLIGTKIRE